MPPTVLFVCTGNVCRSPAAAAMATAWTRPDADVSYTSAGLGALVAEPVDPPVTAALGVLGVSAAEHRARQYAPWMALDASLVLTATGAQSSQILREVPQALRHVFTIKEFARLAAGTGTLPTEPSAGPPPDLPTAVAVVAAMRGRVPTVADDEDDIRDPYRRERDVVDSVVADLAAAVRGTLAALGIARRRPLPYRR